MELNALLALMVQKKASDLFITAGTAPTLKVDGALTAASKEILTAEQTLATVLSIMDPRQKK